MVLSRLSFLFFLLFFLPQGLISQSVGIGTNQPHTSSLLDVHDTLKGVLFPRMSSVQRQSILQPATGLLVFDTDSARYCFYTGQDWHCLGLPPGQASGELLFWDGNKWAIVPPGNQNDRLFFCQGKPVWASQGCPTQCPALLTDTSGITYNTIMLGSHCWTVQNVGTHRFANGDFISEVQGNNAWNQTNTPAWCYYNNDPNQSGYGRYYNYAAAIDARGLCPSGWHVATDADWKNMEMSLGLTQAQADSIGYRGNQEAQALKSISGWLNNGNGNNNSGFTALPAGGRSGPNGIFNSAQEIAAFWAIGLDGNGQGYTRYLYHNDSRIRRIGNTLNTGLSCRCVKN
jgi:uncharacterized protein (TIGR02145 family)